MRVAIMQPYFFPYIGYFQLIGSVDLFILYDNIKYTKRGWINRNRIQRDGREVVITLPLKGASDSLSISERELAGGFDPGKLNNLIFSAYARAEFFDQTFRWLKSTIENEERNLFRYLYDSILGTCEHLGIRTGMRISSSIDIDHTLKGQDKVLALCEAVGASTYINAIGGIELYSKETFRKRNIDLKFIRPSSFEYAQFENEFIPWLSIIDVMMFCSREVIRECVESNYELV